MHMLKLFALGAGLVYATEKISEIPQLAAMSPTIANNVNYVAGGLALIAFKHFRLLEG